MTYTHLPELEGTDQTRWAAEPALDVVVALHHDGRRLEHWRSIKTWEALLGVAGAAPTTQSAAP